MSEQNSEELIQTRLLTRGVHPRQPISLCWRKRYCLIGILALFLISGVLFPFVHKDPNIDSLMTFLVAFLFTVLTLLWCKYDSFERGCRIRPRLTVCIVLLAFVGVPIYLFLTRGWRAFASLVLMILFFAGCVFVECLAEVAACLIAGKPLS
jgi:hypothetical protein